MLNIRPLKRSKSNLIILIDVSWHTHMLHPKAYRDFTLKFLGRVMNHDDTIPEVKLRDYRSDTNAAWKDSGNTYRIEVCLT